MIFIQIHSKTSTLWETKWQRSVLIQTFKRHRILVERTETTVSRTAMIHYVQKFHKIFVNISRIIYTRNYYYGIVQVQCWNSLEYSQNRRYLPSRELEINKCCLLWLLLRKQLCAIEFLKSDLEVSRSFCRGFWALREDQCSPFILRIFLRVL